MITIIVGTRPEIVKTAPLVWELEKQNIEYSVINTGQHYDDNMNGVFFRGLDIKEPDYDLCVNSTTHAQQTGEMMSAIESTLTTISPSIVLVQGDTNSVLAGALTASKMHILVAHVEAGLRSFDKRMPEEINRIITDHISDYLYPPTDQSNRSLLDEGLRHGTVAGNTIVDVVNRYNSTLSKPNDYQDYVLVTLHRADLTDDKTKLKEILSTLGDISEQYSIVFPIHPRTLKKINEFGLDTGNIDFVSPLCYLDFLSLVKYAKMVITDSGGIQEESCILNIPCITYRENTERPETLKYNNTLAYTKKELMHAIHTQSELPLDKSHPFGSGDSGQFIINSLKSNMILTK